MSNVVCLTDRQQKFYNYFVNYYKSNGMFPNMSTTSREMGCNTGVAAATYGTLLLKGCFTNGQPLTRTNKARHNATPIQPVNLANFKLDPVPRRRTPSKPKEEAKVDSKNITRKQLADLLVKLLSDDKVDTKAIAQLIA